MDAIQGEGQVQFHSNDVKTGKLTGKIFGFPGILALKIVSETGDGIEQLYFPGAQRNYAAGWHRTFLLCGPCHGSALRDRQSLSNGDHHLQRSFLGYRYLYG